MKGLSLWAWWFWRVAGITLWPVALLGDVALWASRACFRRARRIVDEWHAEQEQRP